MHINHAVNALAWLKNAKKQSEFFKASIAYTVAVLLAHDLSNRKLGEATSTDVTIPNDIFGQALHILKNAGRSDTHIPQGVVLAALLMHDLVQQNTAFQHPKTFRVWGPGGQFSELSTTSTADPIELNMLLREGAELILSGIQ